MNAFFSEQIAVDFAAKWIAAWNARDLDRILKHYAFEEKWNEFESRSSHLGTVLCLPMNLN